MVDELQIGAADFKANCLRITEEVARNRRPVVITKPGKPIAKLVPIEEGVIDIFGRMAGMITICRDIVGPIEHLEWTADADNI